MQKLCHERFLQHIMNHVLGAMKTIVLIDHLVSVTNKIRPTEAAVLELRS